MQQSKKKSWLLLLKNISQDTTKNAVISLWLFTEFLESLYSEFTNQSSFQKIFNSLSGLFQRKKLIEKNEQIVYIEILFWNLIWEKSSEMFEFCWCCFQSVRILSDFYLILWNKMQKPHTIYKNRDLHFIESFLTVFQYEVFTKDNLHLTIWVRKQEIAWKDLRCWTIYLMRNPWESNVLLYQTDQPYILNECVKFLNRYIIENFKTTLDKSCIVIQEDWSEKIIA